MRYCLSLLIGVVLMSFATFASALEVANPARNFSLQKANSVLDEAYKKVDAGQQLDSNLYNLIQDVKDYSDQAQACIKAGTEQIKSIDALLNDGYVGEAIRKNQTEYNYLQERRSKIAEQTASCSLYAYKATALLENYGDIIKVPFATVTDQKTQPIWSIFDDDIIKQFNVSPEKLYLSSGVKDLTSRDLYVIGFLFFVALVLAKIIYTYCRSVVLSANYDKLITNHIASMTKRYVFLLLPITTMAVLLHVLLFDVEPTPIIVSLAYSSFIYILTIALANFFIYLPSDKSSRSIDGAVRRRIFGRFLSVSTIIFAGYVGALFLRNQQLTQVLVDLIRTSYITLLVFATFWLSWAVFKLPVISERGNSFLIMMAKLILLIGFITLVSAEWLGYHNSTAFIIKGLVLSVFFVIFAWGVAVLFGHIFHVFEDNRYKVSQVLRNITKTKPYAVFIELYMLRIAFYILFVAMSIIILMHIWGVSLYIIDKFQTALVEGVTVIGVTVYPLQVAAGFATFSFIHLLGRIYAARVARKNLYGTQHDTQVALASVVNYVSFTLATVIALLVAGVNFTGLAIIAGALSVGIGFGLQNVANNFLSGLILLIQKPVKPGDRVVVGQFEGFITRIRLLQTQIKTQEREDVMVPNSDLTSQPVTNYMFRDSFWRVTCRVGVAYGSDTDLVSKLLYEVASKHPDVIQEEPNAPSVLFKDFGDSALLFELWVIIRDVNKKYYVGSDLNFEIDRKFRQHNVVIAFPQRDLHIKEVVQTDPSKID